MLDAAATYEAMSTGLDAKRRVEAADDAMLAADPALAWNVLHLARMVETAARSVVGGDATKGNQFLAALAAGAEKHWPADTPASFHGRKLRGEIMAVLGAPGANLLLRVISRDGRLFPGLAAPTSKDGYVNGDGGGGVTPPEEVSQWFAGVPADEIRLL